MSLADVMAVACAEAFRGDGEIMASPMGAYPALGAKLAKATFEPDLVLTDGVSMIVTPEGVVEAPMNYRRVFDTVWAGQRHVMMGATQIDVYGNQNISCLGDHAAPKVMLLGARGAPGNTICHTTSYFVPKHSKRVFVPAVDYVCGLGYDRAKSLGAAAEFHEIRCVISNLGVFDFSPEGRMRVASLHEGVTLEQVQDLTGFDLVLPDSIPVTRGATEAEAKILEALRDGTRRG